MPVYHVPYTHTNNPPRRLADAVYKEGPKSFSAATAATASVHSRLGAKTESGATGATAGSEMFSGMAYVC